MLNNNDLRFFIYKLKSTDYIWTFRKYLQIKRSKYLTIFCFDFSKYMKKKLFLIAQKFAKLLKKSHQKKIK